MKTLTNPRVTISHHGKTATIVCDIADKNFSQFLVQRVTIGHLNPKNMAHPRHVQISDEAIFVKGFGNGFAIPLDEIISIAAAIEPKTSFAPVLNKKLDETLTPEISSELNPDFQWQVSDDAFPKGIKSGVRPADAIWSNINGATSKTLDKSLVKSGQWVRLIASSEAGSMTSNPVQIK